MIISEKKHILNTVKKHILNSVSNNQEKSSISFQVMPTNAKSYESVVKFNPYFKQFSATENLQDFAESIHVTQSLNAVDVSCYFERQ